MIFLGDPVAIDRIRDFKDEEFSKIGYEKDGYWIMGEDDKIYFRTVITTLESLGLKPKIEITEAPDKEKYKLSDFFKDAIAICRYQEKIILYQVKAKKLVTNLQGNVNPLYLADDLDGSQDPLTSTRIPSSTTTV